LYGLEAITTHNGWAMSLAGALIVFAGLVVLSTVISQLHKILGIGDKTQTDLHPQHEPPEDNEAEEELMVTLPKEFPSDIDEIARLYQPLIEEIGDTFYLSNLHTIARKNGFPHPHITLNAFRDAEILIPYGDGVFSWNHPEENEQD
jgi:hypothetical protein